MKAKIGFNWRIAININSDHFSRWLNVMSVFKFSLYSAAFSLCILLPTSVIQAQDVTMTENVMEEIIVTSARRRDEPLAEVPISVTMVSGAELERIGAVNILSLGKYSPNVTLEVSRGSNTTLTAFIRGVGEQDPVAGFEPGVGIYVDDIYLNRPQGAVLDLYDVERLEVLRGPQGTLYGRNTIGGAIKYVTRGLSDEPELKVKLAYGSYNQTDVVVTGSMPLSDDFRIGATVAKFDRDGFGDNLFKGDGNYTKDILGARFSAEWDIAENFYIHATGEYSQDDSGPRWGDRLLVGVISGAPILPDRYDTRGGQEVPIGSVEVKGASVVAGWTIDDNITLKYIFGYRWDETFQAIDSDSLPIADLDVPIYHLNKQTSHELQLQFTGDRLNGVAGFYYLDASAFNQFDILVDQLGTIIGLPGLNPQIIGDVATETWSVFADFSYDLNDQWSVSAGGRYTSDKRDARVLRRTFIGGHSPFFGGSGFPIATTSDFSGNGNFTDFSPRVSVSFAPNESHNLYFSYSEGFKGGGFDPRGQTIAAPDTSGDGTVSAEEVFEYMAFDPEALTSYELGLKSSFLDGRVNTSLAVFFGDYTDVQIPGSMGFDSNGDGFQDSLIGITTNAGKAEIPGFEFEGRAIANEHFSVGWAIGYLDPKYKQFIDVTGNDVADQAVFQNTPKWTAHGNATWQTPLGLFGKPGNFSIIGSVSYKSKVSEFEFPDPLLDQRAYTLFDLSLVWEDDDGHWRAGVHAVNLTDELYRAAGYNYRFLGLEGNVLAFYGNPRTITGTVEYRF
jgi:iron complex outermembrane receptor protein